MDYQSIRQWKQDVISLAASANNLQWEVAYTLVDGRAQFELSMDEWETVKTDIAVQLSRSPATIANWLTTGAAWPVERRERLDIMQVSFTVLAEMNGLPTEQGDALATIAAEQCWTAAQVRAEIRNSRMPVGVPVRGENPVNGNDQVIAAGDGWAWTTDDGARPWPRITGDAEHDADIIRKTWGAEYAAKLAVEIMSYELPY